MSTSKIFFLFSFFLFVNSGFAQGIRKYSNEFLQIGVGARALGMAGAQVASVEDVTAGYWNPAGLCQIKDKAQIGYMHSEYFAGIAKYDYGSFANRLDSVSSIGFSFVRFGVDDIPNTIDLIDANGVIDYNRITNFSITDNAFYLTYSRKLKFPGLSFGASPKVIHRIVGGFGRSWGFGMDAGLQYIKGKWRFGLMGRDITTTFNAWSYSLDDRTKEVFTQTGNEIPVSSTEITAPKLIPGVARSYDLGKSIQLMAEANAAITFDGMRNVLLKSKSLNIDPYAGVELNYAKVIFLRAGIGNIQQVSTIKGKSRQSFQPNFGLGLKIKMFSIDYALTDIGDQSVALYSNVISIRFDLNRKK